MITASLINKHNLLGGLQFTGSVHYHHGETWQCQADMVLEKELRVLHVDLQAAASELLGLLRLQNPVHSDTLPPAKLHLLQQGHMLE